MTSKRSVPRVPDFLEASLYEIDPELNHLIELEEERQDERLILIASESMAPIAIREAMFSVFSNLYAEGYPAPRMVDHGARHVDNIWLQEAYQARYGDRRYYKGVEMANFVESMAIRRAREVFATPEVPADEIHVNVQPLSGAAANNAVYTALLTHGDTILSLDLTHGGHLTHGHPLNRSGRAFHVVHYAIDPRTGHLDYDQIRELAKAHRPKLIVAGFSAYPWTIDWKALREAADGGGSRLMADIAHVAGLVAGGVYPSPVPYADVVTFTTHKTLLGPRGAMILTTDNRIAAEIDKAVFPGEQGGPHVHQIAAKAAILGIAKTAAYRRTQKKIVENAQHLANALVEAGLTLAYGGTDTHMVLVDLRSLTGPEGTSLTGELLARVLDLVGITCNKNTIAGDTSAAHPSAIRLGTPWITQRGMGKREVERIAEVIARVAKAIVPFSYTDTGGEIGRGKIDWPVQAWARAEVIDILTPYIDIPAPAPRAPNALAETYKELGVSTRKVDGVALPTTFDGEKDADGPLVLDRADGHTLSVYGDLHRVLAHLSQSTTAEAHRLAPGDCARGFALGRNAEVITDVTLIRLPDDDEGLARITVLAGPAADPKAPTVFQWLAALSDGYTLFDDEDLISKVEGPVVLFETIGETVLTLVGKGATERAARSVPELNGLMPGKTTAFAVEGTPVLACRFDHADGTQIVQLVTDEEVAPALWRSLTGGDPADRIAPVGRAKRDAVLKGLGIRHPIGTTLGDLPGRIDPGMLVYDKPYFIGMRQVADAATATMKKAREPFAWDPPEAEPKTTCLYDRHEQLARKNYIVDFAGWRMPVRYGSIAEEHQAVREAAGLFDVAHMGVVEFSGPGATVFLDMITTNYVPWLTAGRSHYSYMLDADGRVLDDVMVYKRGDERYMVVVNAGNFDKIWAYVQGVNAGTVLLDRDYPAKSAPRKIRIRDLKDPKAGKQMRVDLALQGPRSRSVIVSMLEDPVTIHRVRQLRRNEFIDIELLGRSVILSGTGYTGEPVSYELYVHPDDAPTIWDGFLAAGEPFSLRPCGLGARDSLRTEAGLPLYGHELAGPFDIGPGGAGYRPFVKLHKPFFVGKAAHVENQRTRQRQIIRYELPGKGNRPAKPGDLLLDRYGTVIGHVTSNAAMEARQVGLAYVRTNYVRPGLEISVATPPKHEVTPEPKIGTRIPTPVYGRILPRFMRKDAEADVQGS